jgi:redox-sensitive bicupin YhaK (pirin superfamily)
MSAAEPPREAITAVPPTESRTAPSVVDPEVRGFPVIPDDRPWIPTSYGEQKYLRLNLTTGEWVLFTRIQPDQQVAYHKHHGGLNLYVLEGELNFVDEEWIAGPGTYVFEPPGNTHVELSEKGVLMLVWSQGPLEFLNADNTPAEVRDPIAWKAEIEEFHRSTGTPMPPDPGYFF